MSRGQRSDGPHKRPSMRRNASPLRRSLLRLPPPALRKMRIEALESRHLLALTNTSISAAQQALLLDGLDDLVTWAGELQADRQAGAILPVVNLGIGALMDLSGALQTGLVTPVHNYFISDVTPTSDELVALLKNLDGSFGNLGVLVDDGSVDGGLSMAGDAITFTLGYDTSRSVSTKVGLGPKGNSLGITFDATATAALTFLLDFTFGVDLTPGLDPQDAWFIQVAALGATANATVGGLTGGINLGFLDASVASGSMTLTAGLTAMLANPDGDAQGRITLEELTTTDLDSLVSFATSGSASGSVTVAVSAFGGFVPSLSPTISFSTGDPFTPPTLTLGNFSEVQPFTSVNAGSFMGILSNVATWLDSVGGTSIFGDGVGIVQDNLGAILKLEQALGGGLIDKLVHAAGSPFEGLPIFDSAQSLATSLENVLNLPVGSVNPTYNNTTKQLTYTISFDYNLPVFQLPLAFDLDLDPLVEISTATQVNFDVSTSFDFTIGLDLSDLNAVLIGTSSAPANGRISADALFTLLVGGLGAVPVTLLKTATDANASIDDLVVDLNAALATAGLAGQVVAARDATDSSRLTLKTINIGPIVSLSLLANPLSPAVTELKFENGHLAFETMFDDVFFEDTSISAAASVSTPDVDASAEFGGYVAVNIVNGTSSASISASFDLTDPTTHTPGARVFLGELLEAVATDITSVIDGPNLVGSLDVLLPLQAVILGLPTAGNPNITIAWADMFSGAPHLQFNNLEDLFDLSHLSDEQIIGALGEVGEFLLAMQNFSLYDVQIPGINKSLGELFDYADRFLQKIEQFLADPNSTINDLEGRLEAALGLPPSLLDIELVDDNKVLRIDVTLGDTWATQLPLQLDLGGDLGGLVDIQASALLDAMAGVTFHLDFGIDLTDFENPKPFLYETTGLDLSAKVLGTNIDFATILGPVGAFVTNGVLAIDGDGNAATPDDTVLLAAGLTDNDTNTTDGKLYFDEIDVDNFELTLAGKVKATLPLYLPTQSTFQGNIELEIGDLADIGGTTTLTLPDVELAFEEFDLFNNLSIVVDGVDYFLVGLRDVLNGEVFGTRLPFIGDNLGEAADFIEDIRQTVVVELQNRFAEAGNQTSEVVRQGIFDALGPQGANLLFDQNNSGTVTIDDIALVKSDTDNDGEQDDQFDFDFTLSKQLAILDEELDFDIGLDALGFEIDGKVELGLGFTWKVGFGISRDYGFYFDTSTEDELTIGLEARIPGLHAEGQLAFLQLDVRDESATDGDMLQPSHFIAGLVVDFLDPVEDSEDPLDDDKLTFADLVSDSFSFEQLVIARLSGDAQLNLDLMLSVRGDARFPSISAEFAMHWPFAETDTDLTGGEPTVAFNNVQLNLGEFIGEFAAPILRTVRQITEPFDPVIEFLTTPIPLISDFGQEVTPLSIVLDIARAYGYPAVADFIDAVIDVAAAVNNIPLTAHSVVIPFGSFDLSGTNLKETEDLSDATPNVTQNVNPMEEASAADADAGNFLDELAAIGIHFPLIEDPGKIFRLLMGQTVDLFLYDMPALEFNVPFPIIKIGPIIPPYPIFFALNGSLGARLDLAFGFDTHGWELFQDTGDWLDIFSGFFISDTANPDGTGEDVLELSLLGRLTGSVEASLIVVSMGGGATVGIDLGADLVDTDGDGKIHIDEFLDNIERGFTCTFNLGGEIWVQATAYLEILFQRYEFTSPRITLVDFLLTDEECFPDRFGSGDDDDNDSRPKATDLGVAPGIHVEGLSLETSGDVDWYKFELLRPDSIDVNVRHSNSKGDLDLEVYDAGGTLIAAGNSQKDGEIARIMNLAAGVYYARVGGDARLNNYKLIIEPNKTSDTRVIYVSHPDVHNKNDSYHTWEKGRDGNDGLTAAKPKATLQSVIDTYTLGPNDMVVFDTGVFNDAAVLTAADSGALFVGSISGSTIGALTLDDSDGNRFYNLDFSASGSTNISLDSADGNRFERGEIRGAATNVTLAGSNENQFENVHFAGPTHNVVLTASHDNVFADNEFSGAGDGVVISDATIAAALGPGALLLGSDAPSSGNLIVDNTIGSAGTGIRIDSPLPNRVETNTFVASGAIGIYLPRGVTSTVTDNDVAGRGIGIYTDSKVADLYGNLVHDNVVGMESRHGIIGPNNEPPYGTPGGKPADQVYQNETGIHVPADGAGVLVRFTDIYANEIGMEIYGDRSRIIANDIHDNDVGAQGTRIIGPENWESLLDNRIHHNGVGVRTLFGAEVRFNRIDHNGVGVEVTEGSYVHHNLIVRNSGDGVFVRGPEFAGLPEDGFIQTYLVGADVINNTIFAPSGNGMRLDGFLRDVRLRNNIAMVESGSALVVHAAAQGGFSSDYNNLYATGSGQVARFVGVEPLYFQDEESPKSKSFADLFDWHVEGNTDLHSLGKTILAPTLDDPLFVSLAGDDYHLQSGSTSVDAGDPSFATADEPAPNGGRIDLGAYGGTIEATASPTSWLRLTAPEFYVDLIPADTYTIAWDAYGLPAGTMLAIEARRVSPPLTRVIGTFAASALSTTWSPSAVVGITPSLTSRWQIHITTTSGPALTDSSREPFAIVPFVAASANTFYVDDASNSGDEYTPFAVGNNRNPGLTSTLPKAAARALLLSYPMGSGDSLYFDTGEHLHVLNLNMRQSPTSLDPLLHSASGTFITGPVLGGGVATIDRMNPYAGAIAIDMRDAPGMTLKNVEVRGGDYGVAVHDGSSGFVTDSTKFFRNTHDGLAIYNNSPGVWIDRVTAWENGRHGVFVESSLDHVRDSIVYDNGETGMALRGVGAAFIERNEAFCTGLSVLCQRAGIDIINPGPLQALVGSPDLELFLGNKVHHNEFEGIFASGNVLVAGNTAYYNGYYGIRLDDQADATRNVAHHHAVGISALGSTSDIVENRSYINTNKGIEAGFESNILRNVTYSNDVNGIFGQRFSGLMEHNLVYATGLNSVHIEGPGRGAQFINNTVYEACYINDTVTPDTTTMDVSWDWQTQIMPQFFFPFSALLWGESRFEFDDPIGSGGDTFDLGPGGFSNALTAMPVPPGQLWQIPFSINTLELHTMDATPLGQLAVRLREPALGMITVENVGGVLVGNTNLSMLLEFVFANGGEGGGETVLWSDPIVIGHSFGLSEGYNEFQALQTVIPAIAINPPIPPTLRPPHSPPFDPPWGQWQFFDAHESSMPLPEPQDRGDFCPELAVLVSNFSRDVYFRNNIIYAEGNGTPGIPTDALSVDVEVRPDSIVEWDSNFNALMTIHGVIGVFNGITAPTLTDWQNVTLDDMHSISPHPSVVWVDPDGLDNTLGGESGFDDNFHLRSPFGQAMTGALAPILDNIPGGTDLPRFEPVTFVGGPGPGDSGVSPAVDWGDPDFSFFAETPENGKFNSLGAYGDTTQSSSTETEYINMVFPLGTEQLAVGATYEIRWRSHNHLPGDTVSIELRHNDATGLVEWLDSFAPNTGLYVWTVPALVPFDDDYVIIIRRPSVLDPGEDIIGISRRTFTVTPFLSYGPTVLWSSPQAVDYGIAHTHTYSIGFTISDNLDPLSVFNVSNYELVEAGTSGQFDDGDDVFYSVTPTYTPGNLLVDTSSLVLSFGVPELPEGRYRVTVRQTLLSSTLLPLDGDADDLSGGDYVREFEVDLTSPTVSIDPVVPSIRNTPIDVIQIVYDEPVTGFGVADVRLTRDGGPNLLTGVNSLISSADDIHWVLGNLSRFTADEGTYVLTLTSSDSNIRDFAGNPLVMDAAISWQVETTPPRAHVVAVAPDPRSSGIASLTVVFSEPVYDFTLSGFEILHDGSPLALGAAQAPTTSDQITWTIPNLAGLLTAEGIYLVRIKASGPTHDLAGNTLGADADETWELLAVPPRATISPVAPDVRNTTVDTLTIQFDKPVLGVNLGDLSLTRGASGNLIAGGQTLTTVDNQTYTLSGLSALTGAAGDYTLRLIASGSDIVDLGDNLLVDDATSSWTSDLAAPNLVDIVDVLPNPRNMPVASIVLVFDKPVFGLDFGDLALIRTTTGGPSGNLLTAAQTLSTSDNLTWTLGNLVSITSLEGDYSLTLVPAGSQIIDLASNPLATGGATTWTTDTTPATVDITDVTPDPRTTGVASIAIQFSEAVTGFDRGDLTLRRGDVAVPLTAAQTLSSTDGGVTWTLDNLAGLTALGGDYELSLRAFGSGIQDAAGNLLPVGTFDAWSMLAATVVSRHVFYNRSKFDGDNAATGPADDAAIATDKQALLPGNVATFANYTSYSRGINGIMVDIANRPGAALAASDFQFRVGNDNNPSGWATGPAPTSIAIRQGAGTGGADRVTLIWSDGAVAGQWLEVTVLATAATGLTAPHVFYFGNAVGESGNAAGNAAVNSTDEIGARTHGKTFLNLAAINDLYDYNRDGLVNATDQILARSNSTTLATALKWIDVSGGPPAISASTSAPTADALSDAELWDARMAIGLADRKQSIAPLRTNTLPGPTSPESAVSVAESVGLRRTLAAQSPADFAVTASREEFIVDDQLFDLLATDLTARRQRARVVAAL